MVENGTALRQYVGSIKTEGKRHKRLKSRLSFKKMSFVNSQSFGTGGKYRVLFFVTFKQLSCYQPLYCTLCFFATG